MPGYHVHAFYTPACYQMDPQAPPIPSGRLDQDLRYAGMLLFMSNASQDIASYDVYFTSSNIGMGPFSCAYEHIGQVNGLFPQMPPLSHANMAAYKSDLLHDARLRGIRYLCGYRQPIHQVWAFKHFNGGVDLYVQTVGAQPADEFQHYGLNVREPIDWWMADTYKYFGLVQIPDWVQGATGRPRSAM